MLSIAIVEDEENIALSMTGHINRYCDERRIKVNIVRFGSAFLFLEDYRPVFDIIFMDILLPGLNGLDASRMLREIDKNVLLIFVTNMANFAIKGYEVGAFDFIVKPVIYDTLAMKMGRALKIVDERESTEIKINVDGVINIVSASKIKYIEVNRHYLLFHTEDGEFRTRGTIGGIEKKLISENFSRCNISFLVNLKYVTKIKGDIVYVLDDELRISRARKKSFMNALTNYIGRTL